MERTISPLRPLVSCAFQVMSACEEELVGEAREACVQGARDAHLQVAPVPPASQPTAYRIGWNSTLIGCPVQRAQDDAVRPSYWF